MTKRLLAISPVNLALCVIALFVSCSGLVATAFVNASSAAEGTRHAPTIDELLTIKSISGAQL